MPSLLPFASFPISNCFSVRPREEATMADSYSRGLWSAPRVSLFRDWSGRTMPEMDWFETPSSHVFKINVPGSGRDEIKVQLEEGNVLSIGGRRAREESNQEAKQAIWHLAEKGTGDFSLHIPLPENVNTDHQIKAGVENGVLTVVVPKDVAPKAKSRSIAISSKH